MLNYREHVEALRTVGYVDDPDGYVVWLVGTGGNAELRHLKVREPGSGAGLRLLRAMLRTLKANPPYATVYGFTRAGNEQARRFYEAAGFVLTEVAGVYDEGSAVLFSQRYDRLCELHLKE